MEHRRPSQKTLDKYGLTDGTWSRLLHTQEGLCAICRTPDRKLVIDHYHAPLYKKLRPGYRALLVRGLLCYQCNRWLLGPTRVGFKSQHYERAAAYLRKHEWLRKYFL